MTAAKSSATRVIEAVTCLGCGCACDDIAVTVRGGRIADARNACTIGAAWFGDGAVPAAVSVDGEKADLAVALDVAAGLLINASRPVVYLAPDISCEAQREGVAIADTLRAALDSVTSSGALPSIIAAQERGRASATLGQVKNFADLVVFWGVDPSRRYPRYWSRYAPEPPGIHTPDGRRSRIVAAVDVDGARGPVDADRRFSVPAADEVAVLTALAALVSRTGATHALPAGPWTLAESLLPVLRAGRYVTIVADAEPDPDGPHRDPGRSAALIALAQTLNGPTRCALSVLRGGGNCSGADAVMTWQTGYPAAVDFSRGYPQYRPHDTAAARFSRQDVDAVLILGSARKIPDEILSGAAQVPCAVVGPRASESLLADADAVIDTGVAGIHEGGIALRMDDVPLPLRPSIDGPPAAALVARELLARVAKGKLAARR